MGVALIGYPNRLDDAGLSGGSWDSTLTLANLQTRRITEVARSTDATTANTQFDADLGAQEPIRVVSIHNHNLTLSATIQIKGSNSSDFSTTVYDSGSISVFPTAYPTGTSLWGEDVGGNSLRQEDLDAMERMDFIHVISSNQTAQYWRVEITDTGNSDGYVQIGRGGIWQAYEPAIGFATGATLGWEDLTRSEQTDGGSIFFDTRERRRRVNFTFADIDTDEALVQLHEMNRRLGTDEQFLFVFDKDDSEHMHRRAFLATLHDLDPLEFPYVSSHNSQAFQAVEEL